MAFCGVLKRIMQKKNIMRIQFSKGTVNWWKKMNYIIFLSFLINGSLPRITSPKSCFVVILNGLVKIYYI